MPGPMTVCIVGAGSSYTPELVDGLVRRDPARLPVGEIRLTDIDPKRLEVMAGLTRRMIAQAGRAPAVATDTRLEAMLDGADFVITQIRVGGMRARYLDESIPLTYGVLGQETTGPGGMCKALRTIPPMLDIARAVERVCPRAFVLNYTNPSGIVTEAVRRHTGARLIGLCSGMPAIQRDLAAKLAADFPDLRSYCVGLNHFGFVYRITSAGRDVTAEAIEALHARGRGDAADGAASDAALARLLGAIPIGYAHYFFHRGRKFREAQAAPMTRAHVVEQIERDVFAEAALPDAASKPQALARRGGGGYAEVTFEVMDAIANDTGSEITVSTTNGAAVEGIEPDAVVEATCRIDSRGAHPLPVGPLPLAFRGVAQALKAYETLTIAAAVQRSRRLALLALANHPLVGDLDVAEPMLDEMLAAHGLAYA